MSGNKCQLFWRWFKCIFFHVFVPCVHIVADIFCFIDLLKSDQQVYFWWSLGVWTVPGSLQLINWTWIVVTGECTIDSWKEYGQWVLFSVAYPFAKAFWNIHHGIRGPSHYHKVTAQAHVLNSISDMTKSPLQVIFQCSCLLVAWRSEGEWEHDWRLISIASHTILLIHGTTAHFFYEVTGKGRGEFLSWKTSLRLPFFMIFHFAVRCLYLTVHFLYLQEYTFIVLMIHMVVNLLIAIAVLETPAKFWAKNVFTAFASIFGPENIFFPKQSFKSVSATANKFRKYALFNSICFMLTALGSLTALVLLIHFLPDRFIFDCDNQPPFSINVDCGFNQTMVHDVISQVNRKLDIKIEAPWFYYEHFGLTTVCCLVFLGSILDIFIVWVEGRISYFEHSCLKTQGTQTDLSQGDQYCQSCTTLHESQF